MWVLIHCCNSLFHFYAFWKHQDAQLEGCFDPFFILTPYSEKWRKYLYLPVFTREAETEKLPKTSRRRQTRAEGPKHEEPREDGA